MIDINWQIMYYGKKCNNMQPTGDKKGMPCEMIILQFDRLKGENDGKH